MSARAVDRSGKRVRPPIYKIENECSVNGIPQYFQVSVNVLEARKLTWSNSQSSDSYVIVVLGETKNMTCVRRNMKVPYYREYFVFELFVSIRNIQRTSLWLAVMEPRSCGPPNLLGEATIDLGVVWSQPHHQVYHKWAQLSLPSDPAPVGFLEVDVSVMFKEEVATVVNEELENNLLLPTGCEQQCANYLVTVHGAYSLHIGAQIRSANKRYRKALSTFVRVSFCDLVAKTSIRYRTNNPMYCEQVSFVEMFPNMNQIIRLEVCSADGVFHRALASADLRLGQISHGGENGFLPTFGPSLLHMYSTSNLYIGMTGEDGPFYCGALLVSLRIIVPYYQRGMRTVIVEPVTTIQSDKLWQEEEFCVFCPVMEVSMLDVKVAGKMCGVAITIGEIPSEKMVENDFEIMMAELRNRKLHYTGCLDVINNLAYGNLEFPNAFPVLQVATRLPDFRFRMYRNNMVYGIIANLELVINDVERKLQRFEYTCTNELLDKLHKALDDTAGIIIRVRDADSTCGRTLQQISTELDDKQLDLQKEELKNIYRYISTRARRSTYGFFEKTTLSRKEVKCMLSEANVVAQSLKNLIHKFDDGWSDIVVWLLNNNGSRVAYSRIPTADIIYSVVSEQCGKNCGRLQTVFMKPIKCPKHKNSSASRCFCITGKIELMLWMGLYRQKFTFESFMPFGYNLKTKDYDICVNSSIMMIECRAFIYMAKRTNCSKTSGITFPFLRVNMLNSILETNVKQMNPTPVWNQLLRLQKLILSTADRLINNPPVVVVEFLETDVTNKTDLIGRFQMKPVVDDRQDYVYAPKLQWFEIYKGEECTGQVLMSVQLLHIPEKLMKSTIYSSVDEIYYAADVKQPKLLYKNTETLPSNLIPQFTSYKVDVFWWGLREVNITRKPCIVLEIDELTVKSDVIANKKPNSNFPNGRMIQVFESQLDEKYSLPLSLRLYDSSTFGRTLLLGTKIVKNPSKFIVNWLPKTEREASLKSTSIISPDFCQVTVNQVVVTRKSNFKGENATSDISLKSTTNRVGVKRSLWRNLFHSKEPDEEEYALLPANKTERSQKICPSIIENKEWWLRFHGSPQTEFHDIDIKQSDHESTTIYDTELELQQQFSKFKDWCATIKLYCGKKTGIPEKDEKLQCGYLKAGIAVYKWPPSDNTVAVSLNGADLNRGFYADHPNNDPANFLVRVYVVRLITAKGYTGKLNPYVIISCGKKHIENRYSNILNTVDPIYIGKMHEIHCTLPEDYLLNVSLYNSDAISFNKLIGSTSIDLEDRVYTKHRAGVGLSTEYKVTGPMKWRDYVTPSAILQDLCAKNHMPSPLFLDTNSVVVNGVEYRDNLQDAKYATAAERKQNICLSLLKNWHTMPVCGYHLVPEHVETRSLIGPENSRFENAKIQMWVDIFPLDASKGCRIPPPINVDTEIYMKYELRLIIGDIKMKMGGLVVNKLSMVSSDVYIKAWIGSTTQTQITDVHFNANIDAQFNWRMIFRFFYQHSRQTLVNKEQGPFTEYQEYYLPILTVQLLDNKTDILLGTLRLNLNCVPRGAKLAEICVTEDIDKVRNYNIFSALSLHGWWPLVSVDMYGKALPVAAVQLELAVLPIEEAHKCPVGFGRQPPAPLLEPKRRKSSNQLYSKVKCVFGARGKIFMVLMMVCSAITVGVGCLVYWSSSVINVWIW